MAGADAALKDLARAIELQQQGRLDDAETLYAKLLAQDDRDPTVLVNAGVLALARHDVETAVARLERAAVLVPANAIAQANLGLALVHAGRADDALAALDRAVQRNPAFATAHNSRGIALSRLHRRDEARRAFEQALAILPAYVEASLNLGELANQAGDSRAARAAYERVLAGDPDHALARSGRAFADALDGALGGAISELEDVVTAHPELAAAWQTLGAVRNWGWHHEAAEHAFRRAVELDPDGRDARFGIASALLARGRYDTGFAAYEASRDRLASVPPQLRDLPAWTGTRLAGALLVHGEQGLGDTIQFSRFIATLRSRVGGVVMLLDGYWRPLAPLLATLAGVDRVVTDAGALAAETPEARCSMLSLPHLAGAARETLPQPPYLSAPPERLEAWRARVDERAGLRVGLAWSVFARDSHGYVSRHKSVPPGALEPMLDAADLRFHALQPGAAGDPSAFGSRADRVLPCGKAIGDFADTAALIAHLDVVVTPDTAVAHLAGAMGKPVCLLERFHGCWRWRLEAESSPWYPSVRIFRQARFDDWSVPVARVTEALRRWPESRDAYQ